MKKQIALMVAFGCIGASAASVNYDLLGRKGSKMNSPMVYKNVDYSKNAKNGSQKDGASLKTRSLAKKGVGITNDYDALTGAFNSMGFDYQYASPRDPFPYYLKRYRANGSVSEEYYDVLKGRYGYMNQSNMAFKSVPVWASYSPNYEYGSGWTNVNSNEYSLSKEIDDFNNPVQRSPYSRYGDLRYVSYDAVKILLSQRYSISWYDNPSGNDASDWADVGVYIPVDALPVQLDWSKSVPFLRHRASDQFTNPTPENEVLASRMYSVLKAGTNRASIYVGKNRPMDPSSDTKGPQIYIGAHPGRDPYNPDDDMMFYSGTAKLLDNYIYENRTVELVAAGNYNVYLRNGHISRLGQAANAVTVGVVDPLAGEPAYYTSSQSYICGSGIVEEKGVVVCNNTRFRNLKPEIYNYSHFYMNDQKRVYSSSSNGTYIYTPYYDGTEMATAYTAGMVAELLSANAFYRWHPEVVKALLMTSSKASGKGVPTYGSMMPQRGSSSGIVHESRYWVGDINKLMGDRKKVSFAVKRPSGANKYTAAITWLNHGSDIGRLGDYPQHFRLLSYRSRYTTIDSEYHNPLYSVEMNQNFQILTSDIDKDYVIFEIQFMGQDKSSANYKDQIVLGFDVAFY